jgi:DNA-binding NarL/FixJ family response regulator
MHRGGDAGSRHGGGARLEAVAKHWAGLGMPLEETYVRLRQAECLISAPADATADKADASDPVERLGLTERELAVLELVARGMTNRQIGEQLFMAPKTASVHVSRILTKLEVSSCVEAATAAQRLGLVP